MWTKREESELINLYPNMFNCDIAKIMGKSKSQIDNKAYQLKIKKSKELLSKVSQLGNSKRIAMGGRDLSYETLKSIASKYKTRIDFIRDDGAAYNSAIIKGWVNDICSHMTVIKFSIPQLVLREITEAMFNIKCSYNNRKILKPYEIDVYYEDFRLGFEYQGIAWHLNNKNDEIKLKLANDKGVNIIFLHETSRNYENDIKSELIKNLNKINKITKKSITEEIILNIKIGNIYDNLYNKDELIEIAKKYTSFVKFKDKERVAYRKLCNLKLIDVATRHMMDKKINKHNYTEKFILQKISEYDNLTEFRKNELQLYKHIKRVGHNNMIAHLKRKPSFSHNEILIKINSYKNKHDFINKNKKMYKYIRNNGLTYMLKY